MSDPRFERSSVLSDGDICEIEKLIQRELPRDFCDFIKTHGGAFVGGSLDGSDELSILDFFGSAPERNLLSQIRLHPDLTAIGALPIARCEVGNLYVLDAENAVHHINYYGGTTTSKKVATSFQDFVDRIVVDFDH